MDIRRLGDEKVTECARMDYPHLDMLEIRIVRTHNQVEIVFNYPSAIGKDYYCGSIRHRNDGRIVYTKKSKSRKGLSEISEKDFEKSMLHWAGIYQGLAKDEEMEQIYRQFL